MAESTRQRKGKSRKQRIKKINILKKIEDDQKEMILNRESVCVKKKRGEEEKSEAEEA